MIKHKAGVSIRGIQPEAVLGLLMVHGVWDALFPGLDMWVTSGTDGQHREGSLHYKGLAWDIRTKTLSHGQKDQLVVRLKQMWDAEWDIVLEDLGGPNEHLHVEFDPK